MAIKFARENVGDVWDEAMPLVQQHYEEIAHYKDIPLVPDKNRYLAIETAGGLRVYTIRDEGRLVGYQAVLVMFHLHYSTSLQAMADVLYLDKPLRGQMVGARFLVWCDEQLRAEGVQMVMQHMKIKHPFGALLRRIGYEPMDEIWVRRLG